MYDAPPIALRSHASRGVANLSEVSGPRWEWDVLAAHMKALPLKNFKA